MIQLSDIVKDTITGFTGIVICRVEWINGCVRFGVQSQKLKDGLPQEPQHFDEQQLEVVKAKSKTATQEKRGGPKADPRRQTIPKTPF